MDNRSTQILWEKYYRDNAAILKRYRPQQFIVESIEELFKGDLRGKIVIETGCGKGLDTIALRARGATAIGVDFSHRALAEFKKNAVFYNVSPLMVWADISTVGFKKQKADCVFHSGVLEHFTAQQQDAILQMQRQWLKKDGYLFIEVPQRYSMYTVLKKILMALGRWAPGWETQFSVASLKHVLQRNGFRVLSIEGRDLFPFIIFRKIKKMLGFEEVVLPSFSRLIFRPIQRNVIMRNIFVNIAAVAVPDDSGPRICADLFTYNKTGGVKSMKVFQGSR